MNIGKIAENVRSILLQTDPKTFIFDLLTAYGNLFKIGFSTTTVEDRIKNAAKEPTYLMAPVKIVSVFRCYNLNPQKFEYLLHTFFGKYCLDLR